MMIQLTDLGLIARDTQMFIFIMYENLLAEEHKAENKKLLTQWTEYLSEFQGSYSISFTKAALLTLAACAMVFIYDGLQVTAK